MEPEIFWRFRSKFENQYIDSVYKEAVPTVDIADRRIVTDPPDGLLPGV